MAHNRPRGASEDIPALQGHGQSRPPGPPFSGLVVTLNDEKYLKDCLGSLSFCSDLTVVDLASSDSSPRVAEDFGARVVTREPVPVVEHILSDVVMLPKSDWIFRLDPDEICPSVLANQVAEAIGLHGDQIGKIELPVQFFFCGRPLRGTIWGPPKWFARVFNRGRVSISRDVHRGLEPEPGFRTIRIPYDGQNALTHYWVDSIRELIDKHRRYIPEEAAALAAEGRSFTWFAFARDASKGFLINLILRRGWKDGWRGLFLSGFYAWYVSKSLLALRKRLPHE